MGIDASLEPNTHRAIVPGHQGALHIDAFGVDLDGRGDHGDHGVEAPTAAWVCAAGIRSGVSRDLSCFL
jgi:hypothetical protein